MPPAGDCAQNTAKKSSAELRTRVMALIEALDANTLKERAAARRELVELGPGILPMLPPPEQLTRASVRESLSGIRTTLERRQARESIKPSRVTLQGTLRLGDIFEEVAQQTGNQIGTSHVAKEELNASLEVDFRNVTFWEVMDDLASGQGLSFADHADAGTLAIRSDVDGKPSPEIAVSYSGAFRVAMLSVRLRPLLGTTSERMVRLRMGVSVEPRLRPLFLKYAAEDISVRRTSGAVLPQFVPDAQYELSLGEGGWQVRVQADFRVPNRPALKSVAVNGRMTMLTAADTQPIRFTRLTGGAGTARRRGGVTVTLRDVAEQTRQGEKVARVRVAVGYDTGGPAFESHRSWVFHNAAYLESSDGSRVKRSGQFTTVLQADGAVAVEYNFAGLKEPLEQYRFVYVAPTLIISVPIEFKFSDVPVSSR